jgi:hypothetical protein
MIFGVRWGSRWQGAWTATGTRIHSGEELVGATHGEGGRSAPAEVLAPMVEAASGAPQARP